MTTGVAGIVLAAGRSSRMGRPKALLMLGDGRTFAQAICTTLEAARIGPTVLVTRAELEDELGMLASTRIVVNPDPSRGQLSSLLVALDALGDVPAALVTLVDLPLVRVSTVVSLTTAWRQSQSPLVRPLVDGHHGHPAIFGRPLLDALRRADFAHGAKPVVHAFREDAVSVPTDDRGVVDDIDTPDAYARLLSS